MLLDRQNLCNKEQEENTTTVCKISEAHLLKHSCSPIPSYYTKAQGLKLGQSQQTYLFPSAFFLLFYRKKMSTDMWGCKHMQGEKVCEEVTRTFIDQGNETLPEA